MKVDSQIQYDGAVDHETKKNTGALCNIRCRIPFQGCHHFP
jgi:hypothetical protein